MDAQQLLVETAEHPPCGPNLEEDPAFLQLESEVQGKPEREVAGTVIPAVEPDWARVRDQATSLLGRTKDLRVALHLVRALTRTEHLAGFAGGVELIRALLERYWSDLHPQLEIEENNDPTRRLNSLAPLEPPKGAGATETLLRDLRDAHVIPPSAEGKVSVRDILVLDGKLRSTTGAQTQAAIDGALRAALEKDAAIADVPARAIAAVQQIRALLSEKVGGELAPNFDSIIDMLKPVAQRMARLAGRTELTADSGNGPAVPEAPRYSGEIRGRDDVNRAIDAICAFLESSEPANPAPLLLRRAQRLLNKSFVEVLSDLAPDSVAQVKLIAGIKDK
jgi:type VI secretion system protein ImpA